MKNQNKKRNFVDFYFLKGSFEKLSLPVAQIAQIELKIAFSIPELRWVSVNFDDKKF